MPVYINVDIKWYPYRTHTHKHHTTTCTKHTNTLAAILKVRRNNPHHHHHHQQPPLVVVSFAFGLINLASARTSPPLLLSTTVGGAGRQTPNVCAQCSVWCGAARYGRVACGTNPSLWQRWPERACMTQREQVVARVCARPMRQHNTADRAHMTSKAIDCTTSKCRND